MSAVDSSDFLNRISWFTSHLTSHHLTLPYTNQHHIKSNNQSYIIGIYQIISNIPAHHSPTYRVPAVCGEEDGVVTQNVDVVSLLPHPRYL